MFVKGIDEVEKAERRHIHESVYDPTATLDEKITCIMQREKLYKECKDELGEAIMQEIQTEAESPMLFTTATSTIDKYYNKLLER